MSELLERARRAARKTPRELAVRLTEIGWTQLQRPWSRVYPRMLTERVLVKAAGAPSIDALWQELEQKAALRPAGSATVAELDAGVHEIGKKIVEEAAEVWMAAEFQSDDETAAEISQLLYHLQVLMLAKGLTLEDVYKHL